MRRAAIVPVLCLLAACGGEDSAKNQAGSGAAGPATAAVPGALAGIYEGGSAARPDQLCIVEKGAAPQFGLIVWGSNDHSCMGAGQAERQGDRLLLRMAGDSTCAIEARIGGGEVTLPASVPEGCAYYCGARAQFGARTLKRSGDDALRAKDLVGDPLCG